MQWERSRLRFRLVVVVPTAASHTRRGRRHVEINAPALNACRCGARRARAAGCADGWRVVVVVHGEVAAGCWDGWLVVVFRVG